MTFNLSLTSSLARQRCRTAALGEFGGWLLVADGGLLRHKSHTHRYPGGWHQKFGSVLTQSFRHPVMHERCWRFRGIMKNQHKRTALDGAGGREVHR
jgi:hypothetical protein